MAEVVLTIAAFLALLVFLVMVLQYELDLSTLVSAMLGMSVMSIGLIAALALRLFVGLSMLNVTFALGGLMFVTATTYELVS